MNEPVPSKRTGHVSVAIGKFVLIWGGYKEPLDEGAQDERYLSPNEVWIYYPDVEIWVLQKTTGEVPPGLSGACAVAVPAEKAMYIMCGHSEVGNVSEIFRLDLSTWTWRRIEITDNSQKPSPRDKFTCWEHKDFLYIFGGFGLNIGPFLHDVGEFFIDDSVWQSERGWNNQLLLFDLAKSTWSNPKCSGCIPSPRAAHGAAKVNEVVYVFGGRCDRYRLNDLYSLNLTNLCWTKIDVDGDIPRGRSWHTFTTVSENQIFLYGGYSQEQETLSDAWLFDVSLGRWRQLPVTNGRPRLWHTAVRSSDNDVIIFGGCTTDILSVAEHTNEVLRFRISPCSLLRLSLQAAYTHRERLESEWDYLPVPLAEMLRMKLNGTRYPTTSPLQGRTCIIS